MTESRLTLEVCVDTPAGLKAAVAGGADRIELCSALSLGGLTPSPGLIAMARETHVPVRVMIRPRSGDFIYSQTDLDAARHDIDAVLAAGLSGVVIGASRQDGHLDETALTALVQHATGLKVTLHRAVDLMPSPVEAVDVAVGLGMDTILTSGGALQAYEGRHIIADMVKRAGARLEILAGSGVNITNAAELIETTGVRALHASCSQPRPALNPQSVAMGFCTPAARDTDQDTVMRLRTLLNQVGCVAA
ncbi:MAG: copper homeostasis protein CutC [Asticcacaulis sp.]